MSTFGSDLIEIELFARSNDELRWFAIADSAQDRAFVQSLIATGHAARCLFDAIPESPVAQHAPYLIELPAPSPLENSWRSIDFTKKLKPVVTIVAADTSFDNLFRQLAECTEVLFPDGEQMFFAFWDPAILGSIVGQHDDATLHVQGPVFTAAQSSRLMHNIIAWWYWDRTGIIHKISSKPIDMSGADGPLILSQLQIDELIEASVPDHVLYYLELNQPLLVVDVPPLTRYSTVRQALVDARKIGLESMQDVVNFACISLIYKDRIKNDVVIQSLMRQVEGGDITFKEALEKFP